MANLVVKLRPDLLDLPGVLARWTQSKILKLEVDGGVVYAAAQTAQATTALIVTVTPLSSPLPDGSNMALNILGEAENPSPARASRALTKLLTPMDGLFAVNASWRERCAEWQRRTKAAETGEQLLGEYPNADGDVGYNPVGKDAFERDARRYLKAVLRHLGWTGKVTYNKAGIAVSGEACFHAAPGGGDIGVFVEVSAGGGWHPVVPSPSGVTVLWHLEPLGGQDRWNPVFRNQWVGWRRSATALADQIQAAHAAVSPPVAQSA
ncbi:hypothetical protein [Deinococcus aquatilis]|uniref:hypothetical protein n=1 Tax=Deinococcus aquatilis TaxID=519440 RepID=UPI000372CEFA|nr:hypothetical protein [Deinococcus aquatilis]